MKCPGPNEGLPPIGSVGVDYKAPCSVCGKRVAVTTAGRYVHHNPATRDRCGVCNTVTENKNHERVGAGLPFEPTCDSCLALDKRDQKETVREKGYNGWTNYETWAVALWIDNEQGTYHQRREIVREHTEAYKCSYALKEWITEMAPDLGATLWSDLLTASLGEVNWHELAKTWMEEEK